MWRTVANGWIYLLADEQRAGRALITLCVADLESVVADIADNGFTVGSVERVGDAGRRATLNDPDGNTVSFIEVAGSAG